MFCLCERLERPLLNLREGFKGGGLAILLAATYDKTTAKTTAIAATGTKGYSGIPLFPLLLEVLELVVVVVGVLDGETTETVPDTWLAT